MTKLKSIRNIGDKMAGMLEQVGIKDAESLQAIGAFEAQVKLLSAGLANHRFYYQALKLGLMGRAWNELDKDEKKSIEAEFIRATELAGASFSADIDHELPPLMAKHLKEIGVT